MHGTFTAVLTAVEGHLDSRRSIQRVVAVTFAVSFAYSLTQVQFTQHLHTFKACSVFGPFSVVNFGNCCGSSFSPAECPSCHPTNSIKALKDVTYNLQPEINLHMLSGLLSQL